jgi:magnesium transporter
MREDPRVIVDCAHYRDGRRQHTGPMRPEDAALICHETPGFVWLGMVDPSQDELANMQDVFGLHELAVEDARGFHLRPKVEQYEEGFTFVVLRTARYVAESKEVEFGEISIFLGPSFVITVRQGAASDLHAARLRLESRPSLLAEGPLAVLWAILDQVVDDYAPVVEAIETDIEAVEHMVFSGTVAPTQHIYMLRREVSDFYRAVHPLLTPVSALARGALLDTTPHLSQYFRDVGDHLTLINEEVIAQRDLLSTILQANHRADLHRLVLRHELRAHARARLDGRLSAGGRHHGHRRAAPVSRLQTCRLALAANRRSATSAPARCPRSVPCRRTCRARGRRPGPGSSRRSPRSRRRPRRSAGA